MGTGPRRQAETPKGGGTCPFCQVGFLTESRSSTLLYCTECGQVIPRPGPRGNGIRADIRTHPAKPEPPTHGVLPVTIADIAPSR